MTSPEGGIPTPAPLPAAPQGRRRERPYQQKGRALDAAALAEVEAAFAGTAFRRDHLIEYLHRLQDRFGALRTPHLAALAHLMKLPMAAVYEVASFYAHFDIVEADARPAPVTVRVCDSLTCALAGGPDLVARIRAAAGPDARVVPAPCIGLCDQAPAVHVGHYAMGHVTADAVATAVRARVVSPWIPDYADLDAYRAAGGYRLLAACRAGTRTRAEVIKALEEAGLRGLGGAGFPTARKWSIVAQQPAPRLLAVNADEGEPGTFKDRHYLESDPHRFLEGLLIAAWAVGIDAAYVYLRDEYPHIRAILARELKRLAETGLDGGLAIELRRGAGAYICGEESAMLESIEGKRGLPRHKPPYPSEIGLFGRPTLTHNPETLFWVRDVVERGAAWFTGQGRNGRKGLRSFSVSGRVRSPGVKLAPAGISVAELIAEFCGGMAPGHSFRAYLPGGASGGILPARLAHLPLDFGTLESEGCFIGSAAVVVLSDRDNIADAALNLMRFFADESCGQCTPCRVGTEKAVTLMERPGWDAALLHDLAQGMQDASICGLGQAAPNPLLSVLKHFPEDITARRS